ncbi:MAG: sulfopyruvate decarboxylase subunit beta [ANME-2 cluster archaeon]|nr:sulfopyruvate decarboxylase subunit beta [ANME-2 cluster archaeon]
MDSISPEEHVVELLKVQGIDLAATLPCDRMKRLLPLIETNVKTVQLTREENGVGICAGHYLGGGRPVMVIQSTGLGNMFNALLSLNATYNIPLPIIVSWRGVYKESIPAQVPLGLALPGMLEAANIKYTIIDTPSRLGLLEHVISDAFDHQRAHVALIQPSVWETSCCAPPPSPKMIMPRACRLELDTYIHSPTISRYQAIRSLVSVLDDEIVVSNIGIPSKELYHIGDRSLNFYMLGSMGVASAIGLGLAMVQHRHVIVIDGDGSLLMNPNVLTQIAVQSPPNLIVVAVNNGAYGSTGNQETAACRSLDMELMARGHGIQFTAKTHTETELQDAYLTFKEKSSPSLIDVVVKPVNELVPDISLGPVEIKERFMNAVLRS